MRDLISRIKKNGELVMESKHPDNRHPVRWAIRNFRSTIRSDVCQRVWQKRTAPDFNFAIIMGGQVLV